MDHSSECGRFYLFRQFKELNGSEPLESDLPTASITLAVDELSHVRSTLGYAVGEQVLELCAERLVSETREGDLVIALGGDTFAVIVRRISDPCSVFNVAERLIERLQRSYLVEGHLIDIEVSAGIAMSSDPPNDLDDLLSKSSLALRAIRGSRSRKPCFFERAMKKELVLEQALTRDLRRALPLRQFTLHYQPQVDMNRRKVTGVEALLRWQHPVRGAVSPSTFIPIAESTGAIHALGAWVLRTACKEAATLPTDITMAVNVSPIQLRSLDFVREVGQALSAAKLPGSRLEIEITEGILLDTSDATLGTIHALKNLGVKFAIDDFGTGYSSLGQVGRLPFDTLKIDRSLVSHNPRHRAVVRAVLALASGLGMDVVAEGVETEQELRALKADGCSLFQGYLFGRPVPALQLMSLLEQIQAQRNAAIVDIGLDSPRGMSRSRCRIVKPQSWATLSGGSGGA
jgi:diguanylate cyclase (GGDEF)-like protein